MRAGWMPSVSCLKLSAAGETPFFRYGERETQWLKSRDAVLGRAIDEIGGILRPVIPDLFQGLVSAMIAQQISAKANATVWNRMNAMFSPMTPQSVSAVSAETLQSVGITMKKAAYIKELAESVVRGEPDLEALKSLPDREVISQLSSIRGVGVWTAEMVMTFSMQRCDIMSWGDLAIHRGLRMLYGHSRITKELFSGYRRLYSPYATVASLYLWAIAAGACPGLTDPAAKP